MSVPKIVTKPAEPSDPNAASASGASSAANSPAVTGESDEERGKRIAKEVAEKDEAELSAMLREEEELKRRSETARKKREAADRLNKLREETAREEAAAFEAETKSVAPPAVMYRDPSKIRELEQALAHAKKTEEEAFRAARDARADSIVEQSRANNGEVDHERAGKAAEKAAEAVRRRAYAGSPRGIYVRSNLETTHPNGTGRVVLTPGTRVPDGMLSHYPPELLQQHFDDGILEDLR